MYAKVGIFVGFAALGLQAQEPAKERIVNGGVLNGKAIALPKPEFPSHLREQGKGGTVTVDVLIDETGMVVSAEANPAAIKIRAGAEGMIAEKEDVDPALVEAAEQAALNARFAPTFLSGVPVKVRGSITYNFMTGERVGEDDPSAVKGGVLNGKALSLPIPGYPPAARAVKAEGAVNVMVKVNEAGEVIEAQAVSGHPLLRAAAVTAAREARFSPTSRDGQPVQIAGVLVYNFVAGEKDDQ